MINLHTVEASLFEVNPGIRKSSNQRKYPTKNHVKKALQLILEQGKQIFPSVLIREDPALYNSARKSGIELPFKKPPNFDPNRKQFLRYLETGQYNDIPDKFELRRGPGGFVYLGCITKNGRHQKIMLKLTSTTSYTLVKAVPVEDSYLGLLLHLYDENRLIGTYRRDSKRTYFLKKINPKTQIFLDYLAGKKVQPHIIQRRVTRGGDCGVVEIGITNIDGHRREVKFGSRYLKSGMSIEIVPTFNDKLFNVYSLDGNRRYIATYRVNLGNEQCLEQVFSVAQKVININPKDKEIRGRVGRVIDIQDGIIKVDFEEGHGVTRVYTLDKIGRLIIFQTQGGVIHSNRNMYVDRQGFEP